MTKFELFIDDVKIYSAATSFGILIVAAGLIINIINAIFSGFILGWIGIYIVWAALDLEPIGYLGYALVASGLQLACGRGTFGLKTKKEG
jgi:hypothetical protein